MKLKIQFNRIKGAARGRGLIGIDELKIIEREIIYDCTFDDATNRYEACNGKFYYNLNGNEANLMKTLKTNQIGYDLTDVSSIDSPTINDKFCNVTTDSSYFCVNSSTSNLYRCAVDSHTYDDCNLGNVNINEINFLNNIVSIFYFI